MPWINKPKKKRDNEGKRKERSEFYNTSMWKKLRLQYVMSHPTSEISEWEDKVALTEHVHHIISFTDVPKEKMFEVGLDINNLIAVTAEEHNRLHNGDLRGCRTKEEIKNRVLRLKLIDWNK